MSGEETAVDLGQGDKTDDTKMTDDSEKMQIQDTEKAEEGLESSKDAPPEQTQEGEQPETEKPTEIQFYGAHFHQLIDPEPSVSSLFKLQMTRCVERTVQCHALVREADKLIRAEQLSAEALGKLGMEFGDSNLKVQQIIML